MKAKAPKGSDAAVRKIALTLPEATESPHFDMPSFRVRGKIFATARLNEPKAMVKLAPEIQRAMAAKHPDLIEPVPGGWGAKGATFVRTDKASAALLRELLESAWAGVAPKTLVAAYAAARGKS